VSGVRAWALRAGTFSEEAALPLSDRGFRFGMSVFETLAVRRGRILFLAQHLSALEKACAAARFRPGKIESLSSLDGLPDGLLRIYVTAGDGGPLSAADECRTFAFFEPARFPEELDIAKGLRIVLGRGPFVSVLPGWKTGNYWPNVRALRFARDNGFDEILVFNNEGNLVSASMANVFLVISGTLCTPALHTGARDGVVRSWVKGVSPAVEPSLRAVDAGKADECFLTSSRLGVMPVAEVEGRSMPSRRMGDALAALYCERVLGE
jgi:branched-subunit amino acid aminotransferase/4-amino-4-deoxychorismate lyase